MFDRIRLAFRYLCNNRIKEYDDILQKALDNGYQIISLYKYATGDYDVNKKILILRHDVDHVSGGAIRMFEVEKKHGAYASYYFRDSKYDESTTDKELMSDIESYGSEASLHYESIANYGIEKNIISRKDLLNHNYLEECQCLLQKELNEFRIKYCVPCKTIASHGTEFNSLVGVSNNYLTEDTSIYPELGIVLESYNKEFIEKMGIYISDTPIEYNKGYRYGTSPLEAIDQGTSPILFLTHPNHWHYSVWQQAKKIVKMLLFGVIERKGEFVRIIY